MAYNIELDKRAEKQLNKLQPVIQIKVVQAIETLSKLTPHSSGIKKLKAPLVGYRKRVGSYRLLFDIDSKDTLTIYKIKHRKDAYK